LPPNPEAIEMGGHPLFLSIYLSAPSPSGKLLLCCTISSRY
jgi:hypothetical protein